MTEPTTRQKQETIIAMVRRSTSPLLLDLLYYTIIHWNRKHQEPEEARKIA